MKRVIAQEGAHERVSENRRVEARLCSSGRLRIAARSRMLIACAAPRAGFGEMCSQRLSNGRGRRAGSAPQSVEQARRALARVLADLGPTYIKLGQLLATREDLFPPEVTRALVALHSGVPPMKPRVVERRSRPRSATTSTRVRRGSIRAAGGGVDRPGASRAAAHRRRKRGRQDPAARGSGAWSAADLPILRWLRRRSCAQAMPGGRGARSARAGRRVRALDHGASSTSAAKRRTRRGCAGCSRARPRCACRASYPR